MEKPSVLEIWYRSPKFILGFIVASLVFSTALVPSLGMDSVDVILSITKEIRKMVLHIGLYLNRC